MKANNFDVMKAMSERDQRILLAPVSNILRATKTKLGTQITIGVEGNLVGAIMRGEFVGGLILADKVQFRATKAELEQEAAGRTAADIAWEKSTRKGEDEMQAGKPR